MSISIPTWSQIYCTSLSWKSSFSVLFQPSTNFNQTQSTTGAKTGAGGCPHTTERVHFLCLQLCCDKLPLFNSLFTKSPFQKLSPSYNPAHTRVIPLSKLLPFNIRVWCVIRYEHWTSLGQGEEKREGTIVTSRYDVRSSPGLSTDQQQHACSPELVLRSPPGEPLSCDFGLYWLLIFGLFNSACGM